MWETFLPWQIVLFISVITAIIMTNPVVAYYSNTFLFPKHPFICFILTTITVFTTSFAIGITTDIVIETIYKNI